jgi:hypothetical protein
MTRQQAAAERIRKFIDEYKKMRGLHPEMVYEIHAGDDHRQAAITIADLEALLARPEPEYDEMDEEAATVISWLLGVAVQAADASQSYAAGKLTLAAQLLGERRPTIKPVPGAEVG